MKRQTVKPVYRFTARALHIDFPLLGLLFTLVTFGLLILYSASNANLSMIFRQSFRLIIATFIMLILGYIPPHKYKLWTPWIYSVGLALLIAVMIMGKIGKGAQRWLDLGIFRFQPSEIMKLAVPMMSAWFFDKQAQPSNLKSLLTAAAIIFIPAILIAKQPDLGTGIMVAVSGLCVVFLAGIRFKIILLIALLLGSSIPVVWHLMHDYQKQRVYTLLDPEQDPLGSGYHIIQSKIAIGSGGLLGKGWQEGTQSHLNFLPEHATDFIFAVSGEEFGFVGSTLLVILYVFLAIRGYKIAMGAPDSFAQYLVVGIVTILVGQSFLNIASLVGLFPLTGVPLVFISHGGTSLAIALASAGMVLNVSAHESHKKKV